MIPINKSKCFIGFVLYLTQFASLAVASTQFASHVSISTPARSFSHGVGDPIRLHDRRGHQRQTHQPLRSLPRPKPFSRDLQGYPRNKPTIPFTNEDRPRSNQYSSPWLQNNYREYSIPVLPPSPYKVDSPDPESLWPEGLFLPPLSPPSFLNTFGRRSDTELEIQDPYLLEGSEAISAVKRADRHGVLFFHDIPHIESLLANQELREKNNLKPHLIASIRHTWPYNRP